MPIVSEKLEDRGVGLGGHGGNRGNRHHELFPVWGTIGQRRRGEHHLLADRRIALAEDLERRLQVVQRTEEGPQGGGLGDWLGSEIRLHERPSGADLRLPRAAARATGFQVCRAAAAQARDFEGQPGREPQDRPAHRGGHTEGAPREVDREREGAMGAEPVGGECRCDRGERLRGGRDRGGGGGGGLRLRRRGQSRANHQSRNSDPNSALHPHAVLYDRHTRLCGRLEIGHSISSPVSMS